MIRLIQESKVRAELRELVMKSGAYLDGYESGIAFQRIVPQEKSWFATNEYPEYTRGHLNGQLDWAECYAEGRYSVLRNEKPIPQDDALDRALYMAYLTGRRDELNA